MKNNFIRNRISRMSNKDILDKIIMDALMVMKHRKLIREDVLERIVLVHLSFFGEINFMEYDELSVKEKFIIFNIISKGIASIYVDDEYMNVNIITRKSEVIEELISVLLYLTKLDKKIIKEYNSTI